MLRAITAEFLKLKGSKVPLWTALAVVAYAFVAIAGAVAIKQGTLVDSLRDVGGAWALALERGYYEPTWANVLRQNVQGLAGNLGLLLFGFVAAYVFGRERKEGTDATLLTAPVQRRSFAVAKLVVVAVWVLALTLLSFVLQTAGFAAIGFEGMSWGPVFESLWQCVAAAALLYTVLPFVGFVALLGKPGYLRPMLFTVVLMASGNSVAMTEYPHLYPPTMPLLFAGASWLPVVEGELTATSWVIAAAFLAVGVALVVWKFSRAGDARA